ncbi:PIN domain-containing protein [Natrinema sp. 1APR25-10V2]|uniref:PIN domain-containing protein n=1 Tax=Natrinema sp. 1APR25-10V2 TaxID=2951081 RepID=UPI0028741B90|nr:PIN domain-containing protein [Natrinema sp. 1APR25-10V2]MDS0474529.1 PIN domain-containing protein [Natrinema sp. 1APR25-10V2]
MTVVFDAEALLAFSFDEQGAGEVKRWLDRVYDGELDGYIATINLAEFRYITIREASVEKADAHIDDLRDMGVTEYNIDDLWETASDLKATYSPAIGDAYAVAAAKDLDNDDERTVTLLVGADDDYDVFEEETGFKHLIERFRDDSA